MPTLTADQIAGHAYTAGFRKSPLATAVAVALAESGGRTDAVAKTSKEHSIGLWQINTYAHPGWGVERLKNPAENAYAAYTISLSGLKWTPWSAYTNGSYKKFLPPAEAAAAKVEGAPPAGTKPGLDLTDPSWAIPNVVEKPAQAADEFLATLGKGETWVRVALVVGGSVALVLAVVLMAKDLGVSAVVGDVVQKAVG